ncbi:MAG: hypothetical protein MN733_34605 [Nitrososphaera sp.]|nr:hypothetical protein [Nitrososphaera sp.]
MDWVDQIIVLTNRARQELRGLLSDQINLSKVGITGGSLIDSHNNFVAAKARQKKNKIIITKRNSRRARFDDPPQDLDSLDYHQLLYYNALTWKPIKPYHPLEALANAAE